MLPSLRPLRSRLRRTRPLDDYALDHLRFIRATMESAASFTAVPGWGGVAVGFTALGTALLAARLSSFEAWLAAWMGEAALAFLIGGWAVRRKARRVRVPVLSRPARKFALGLAPPMFAGALLTLVLYRAGMGRLIPGMWLLLYGAGFV